MNYYDNPNKIIISFLLCLLNVFLHNYIIINYLVNYFYYIITIQHIKQIILFNIQNKLYFDSSFSIILFYYKIIIAILSYKYFYKIFNKIINLLKFLIILNFLSFYIFYYFNLNNSFTNFYFFYFNYIFTLAIINFIIFVAFSFIKINLFFTKIRCNINIYILNIFSTISGIYFMFICNIIFNNLNFFYYLAIFYILILTTFNVAFYNNINSNYIFYPFCYGFITSIFFIYKKNYGLVDGEIYFFYYFFYYYINQIILCPFTHKNNFFIFIKHLYPLIISFNFYGFNKILFLSIIYSISLFIINYLNYHLISLSFFVKIYKKNNIYYCNNNKIFIEKSCSICLENYIDKQIIVILNCNHVFHKDCFTNWTNFKKICPICRNIYSTNFYQSIFIS